MEKNWTMRGLFILALIIAAVVMLLPSFMDRDKYPILNRINEGLNLGLDLKGGIHFVLSVDVEKAVQDRVDRQTDEIAKRMEEEKIPYAAIKADPVEPIIRITLQSDADADRFRDKVIDYFPAFRKTAQDGLTYELTMREDYIKNLRESSVDQALETLRSRIDALGLKEPVIVKQGSNSILIQLPGYKDIERARSIIGQTAQLEFKIAAEDLDPLANVADVPQGITLHQGRGQTSDGAMLSYHYAVSEDKDLLLNWIKDKAPEGTEFLLEETFREGGKKMYQSWLLYKKAYLTGDMLTDARVEVDQQRNRPYVSLSFDRNGAQIFEEVTGKFVKRKMAIVLDNRVNSAPVIQTKIAGGHAMITLNSMNDFNTTLSEAKDLALVLRAGSLPAPVTFEENRTVGPSLGADSIHKGKISIAVGLGVVVLAMIVYYGLSGLIADIALALNVLFILAFMAAFGATLTFPGIAGIVLTIGMAVDANVLINERLREELRNGHSFMSAFELGYERAFSAIFDSNLTTAIAGFFLWNFGSGTVKGFAITLLLGIASSMFTAVYVTKVIFHLLIKAGIKKVSV